MPTTKEKILIVLILLICGIVVASGIIYQSTPTSILPMNITIVEKYPVHTYQQQCGKTMCSYTDPPKVIDAKGDLYIVKNENDWAKMQINKTYTVQYARYPNSQRGKIVGINY
jgi:hypothetical protein